MHSGDMGGVEVLKLACAPARYCLSRLVMLRQYLDQRTLDFFQNQCK